MNITKAELIRILGEIDDARIITITAHRAVHEGLPTPDGFRTFEGAPTFSLEIRVEDI